MLKKIRNIFTKIQSSATWKDPVYSKLISNLLWSILVILGGTIYLSVKGINFQEFISKLVPLYWVFIGIFAIPVVNFFRSLLIRKPSKTENYEDFRVDLIKNELKKVNYRITDNNNLRWKWDVYIYDDYKIQIDDLKVYCNKHEIPQLLYREYYELKCPVCNMTIPTSAMTPFRYTILSHLEDRLSKLKEEYGIQ